MSSVFHLVFCCEFPPSSELTFQQLILVSCQSQSFHRSQTWNVFIAMHNKLTLINFQLNTLQRIFSAVISKVIQNEQKYYIRYSLCYDFYNTGNHTLNIKYIFIIPLSILFEANCCEIYTQVKSALLLAHLDTMMSDSCGVLGVILMVTVSNSSCLAITLMEYWPVFTESRW